MANPIGEKDEFWKNWQALMPVIPIPVFAVLAAVLYLTELDDAPVFDPPYLLPTLNFVFLVACPMVVAYMAVGAYLRTGAPDLMMLATGVFSLGTGNFLGGVLLSADGPNALITVHNSAALAAGVLHLSGALCALTGFAPEPDRHRRKRRIRLVLSAITVILLLLALGVSRDMPPLFFVHGKGPTFLRQAIIGSAIASFFSAAGLFMVLFRNSGSRFLFWYGNALALICVGLGCFFIENTFDSPISWLGRGAEYLSGIYFIAAVFSGARETGAAVTGFDKVLEMLFRNRFEILLRERTRQLSEANEALKAEIAQREKLEHALKESEEQLKLVLEGGRIGFWDWDILAGTVKRNKQWAEMLGYTLEEIEFTVTQWTDLHHPDDRDPAWRSIRNHLDGVTPCHEMEYRMRTKSGDYKWILDRAMIVKRDEQGKPTRMCGTHADVSRLKWTEEALRSSEVRYRSMMAAMKDAACICSDDYRVTYMNPMMIGRIGRNATGERCYRAIYDRDEKCPWCVFDRVKQGEHVEHELSDTPDKRRYAVSNSPMPLQDGSISKLTIFRDITEIKAMESRLNHVRKMESIGTLAGGIAHNFNNILGIIIGNTELAMEDIPENHPGHSNLEEIRKAGLRAATLVRQLLEFSRKTDLQSTPVDISKVIADSLDFLRSTIPATIEIRREDSAADPTILGDPAQIGQLIMNLCINAAQEMERTGGILEIRLDNGTSHRVDDGRTEKKEVRVIVRDTGSGIAPDVIERIFDPYFTTKEVGKGAGMGLAVAHGIVESHGGTIRVDSAPGKGATFTIRFPLLDQASETRAEAADAFPHGVESILLVDDEASIVDMTRMMLTRLGYRVETATDPAVALTLFRAEPGRFDLVIIDTTMSGMDGGGTFDRIRALRPDLPVLLSSGYAMNDQADGIMTRGGDGFIQKPYSIAELSRKIRNILDKRECRTAGG